MRILITGSREANPELLALARRTVQQAKSTGDEIVVGDADGVDAEVIRTCDFLGVPVQAHGAYGKMRRKTKQGVNIPHNKSTTYTDRDKDMVFRCDKCVALWNGVSRGAYSTWLFAHKLEKEAEVFVEYNNYTPPGFKE